MRPAFASARSERRKNDGGQAQHAGKDERYGQSETLEHEFSPFDVL